MGILYILNYVDRSALAATKVYGIMDDLNMSEAQFATAIAILFGMPPASELEWISETDILFSWLHPLPNPLEPHHDQDPSSRSL